MNKIFIFLFFGLYISACDEPQYISVTDPPKVIPVEHKLAVSDDIYDTTDVKVRRIRELVNELSYIYAEPKDSIAEYTFRAQSELYTRGIQETCLNILEQMQKFDNMRYPTFKENLEIFIVLRENQFSR